MIPKTFVGIVRGEDILRVLFLVASAILFYSEFSFAKNDWCIDPLNPPCGGEEGECVMNTWPKKEPGGFRSNTVTLERGSILTGRRTAHIDVHAEACGNAVLGPNVMLLDQSKALGKTHIFGTFRLHHSSMAYGNSRLEGGGNLYGDARVYDDAELLGNVEVFDGGQVREKAFAFGNSRIYGEVFGYADVLNNVIIPRGKKLSYDAPNKHIYSFELEWNRAKIFPEFFEELAENYSGQLSNLGIDLNEFEANGNSILHFAVIHKYDAVFRYLVKRGANGVSRANSLGMTPFFLAAERKRYEILDFLLDGNYVEAGSEIKKALKTGKREAIDSLMNYLVYRYCKLHQVSPQLGKRKLLIKVLIEAGFEFTCPVCLEPPGFQVQNAPLMNQGNGEDPGRDQLRGQLDKNSEVSVAACGKCFCTKCLVESQESMARLAKASNEHKVKEAEEYIANIRMTLEEYKVRRFSKDAIQKVKEELKVARESLKEAEAESERKAIECPMRCGTHRPNEVFHF